MMRWPITTGLLVILSGCIADPPPDRRVITEQESEDLAAFNYKLAERFWERDRKDLAFRYLEMAVRQHPESAAPRLKILDLYLYSNNPDAALRYLDECPEALSSSPAFLKRRILALTAKQMDEEADAELKEALAAGIDDPQITIMAAESRLLGGEPERALELLKHGLSRHPQNPGILEMLADLCRVMDLNAEEADCRMKLAGALPGEPEHVRLAARAFVKAGLIDPGITRISNLLEITPPADRPFIQASMGYLYACHDDYDEATLLFERAFSNSLFTPLREETLAFAEACLRKEKYDRAVPLLERELERYPAHALTRAALAWAYHCQGEQDLSRRVMAEAPSECSYDEILLEMDRKLNERDHEDS